VPYPSWPLPPALIYSQPRTRTRVGGFPGKRCAAVVLPPLSIISASLTPCAVLPPAEACGHPILDGLDRERGAAAGDEKISFLFYLGIMRLEAELGIRRLVLTASTFSFLIGLPIIYGLQYLSPDHVQLRSTLTAYIVFLLVVSCIGIIAAVTVRLVLYLAAAADPLIEKCEPDHRPGHASPCRQRCPSYSSGAIHPVQPVPAGHDMLQLAIPRRGQRYEQCRFVVSALISRLERGQLQGVDVGAGGGLCSGRSLPGRGANVLRAAVAGICILAG
jgi:hypothetical protein